MKILAFSLVFSVALVLGDGVFEGLESNMVPCQEKCTHTFNVHTNPEMEDEMKACQGGCRLMSVIASMESNPLQMLLEGQQQTHDVPKAHMECDQSCLSSFPGKEKQIYACKQGCVYEIPAIESRQNKIKSPLASFFGSSMNGMPRGMPAFVLRIPSSLSFSSSPRQLPTNPQIESLANDTEEVESVSEALSFSDMFSRMHEQMNSMMSNMMHGMPSLSGMGVPEGARGKMVVVKSGPGFSETKTYDINPDGSRTEVESEVTHHGQVVSHENLRMNDMMNKMNPMDMSNNLDDDVEVFEPKTKEVHDEQEAEDVDRANIVAEIQNDHKIFDFDIFNRKPSNYKDDSSFVHGFDFKQFEEPRMSSGLRPYHGELRCLEDSETMKWSDWVSCLHMRMGLPRWLTAATISLGIVFIIWLCLVIPHSAPKQRVKMTKAMEAAQSCENIKKSGLIIMEYPPAYSKLDFPPSYEDLPNLHVNLPAPEGGDTPAEAGALPTKVPLENSKV
ncbi:hypothetical protein TCAL_09182 [Tigriopus californicus]|uniref:Uncharacterized protein n=1 Tax=Tigriopus californicus TaxID=6832 RepID=A0A553PAM2_TIGCA|nr:uncharacterized protein LOC131893227 [Tigriopus californicus]TRY74714.1 hypothetical protein TCAL_09182 [Tigriopus californicus]